MAILKGNRTRLVALLAAMAPLVELVAQVLKLPEWQGIIPAGYWDLYCLGVSILMLVMREFTTTPPGRRQ